LIALIIVCDFQMWEIRRLILEGLLRGARSGYGFLQVQDVLVSFFPTPIQYVNWSRNSSLSLSVSLSHTHLSPYFLNVINDYLLPLSSTLNWKRTKKVIQWNSYNVGRIVSKSYFRLSKLKKKKLSHFVSNKLSHVFIITYMHTFFLYNCHLIMKERFCPPPSESGNKWAHPILVMCYPQWWGRNGFMY
jgi:hypothetical protein